MPRCHGDVPSTADLSPVVIKPVVWSEQVVEVEVVVVVVVVIWPVNVIQM